MRLRGLYAVTDAALTPGDRLVAAVREAVAGGAAVVQYRDKSADLRRRFEEVKALLAVCRPAGVPLIVNDDVELAAESGADGVHLGRDDGAIAPARARLGADALIGISCYNELDRAIDAATEGADYVAFGSCFPSTVKPDAVRADAALFTAARRRLDLPLVAIGGITPENGASLVAAGADCLAVISGLFGTDDIRAAAAGFAALF